VRGLRVDQLDGDGNPLRVRAGRVGVHPYALEVAARLQRAVQFGDQVGIVGGVSGERHHARQQVLVERRIAGELHLAEAIARAAVEYQIDIGITLPGVDIQALSAEASIEITVARGLVQQLLLGFFVAPVIEHLAAVQPLRHTERRLLRRRSLDLHTHVAQTHRLAGLDAQDQPRRLAALYLAVDLCLVIAERLQGLSAWRWAMRL